MNTSFYFIILPPKFVVLGQVLRFAISTADPVPVMRSWAVPALRDGNRDAAAGDSSRPREHDHDCNCCTAWRVVAKRIVLWIRVHAPRGDAGGDLKFRAEIIRP